MPPITRRTLLVRAAVAPVLAAFLAACGDDDEAQSTLTGTLNFLNFPGWAGPTTYDDFAASFTGASVNEVAYVSSDDSVAKAKNRAGDLDLLLVDGTTFPRLTAIEALSSLGELANLSAVAPAYLGNSWDTENQFFAPTDHGRTGIIYRRDLVDADITSWADFFAAAPGLSGKVAVLDYNRSVMGSVMRLLGRPASSTEQADLDAVLTTLLEVKPHLATIATEVGPLVADGTVALAMADVYDSVAAIEANPDVVWVDPAEGSVGYLEGLAVLEGPRADLARKFVDFFLEPANYAAFINNVRSPYVQPDNAAIDPTLTASPIVNPPAEVAALVEFHEFLGDSQAAWDTTWDAFKSA
jgi:spermidine/putrescine-binding protein